MREEHTIPPGSGDVVAAGLALVHHALGEEAVQHKYVLMRDYLLPRVLLYVAKAHKVVYDLPLRAGIGGELPAFLYDLDLFKGKRVALDGCRGMDIPCSRVLQQGRYPCKLDCGALDALT